MLDPTIEFSESSLARIWVDEKNKQPILLDLANRLPADTRDRMGTEALVINSFSNSDKTPQIFEVAMQLFATKEARDLAVESSIRVSPASESMLRGLQKRFEIAATVPQTSPE